MDRIWYRRDEKKENTKRGEKGISVRSGDQVNNVTERRVMEE